MRKIAENLWVHEDFMTFVKGYPVDLRMTIVKTENGGLWIHSPTKLSDALRTEIASIGKVAFIVAASNGHNIWLKEWADAFPQAEVFVTRGIPKKVPTLKKYKLLEDTPNPPWSSVLKQHLLAGVPMFDEHVFLHNTSRSLIVTDFVQDHSNPELTSFAGKFMFKCLMEPLGFRGICLAPPLKMFFVKKNMTALCESIRGLFMWDFDRIIITHGKIIEDKPKDLLRSLCKKYLA